MTDYLILQYWTHLRIGSCKAGEYEVGATFYQPVSLEYLPLGISVEQNCVCVPFLVWLTAHKDNKSMKSGFKIYLLWVLKRLCDVVENLKTSLGCITQMRISDVHGSLFVLNGNACWKSCLWNPQCTATRKTPDASIYQAELFWYGKTDRQTHLKGYLTSSLWRKERVK